MDKQWINIIQICDIIGNNFKSGVLGMFWGISCHLIEAEGRRVARELANESQYRSVP